MKRDYNKLHLGSITVRMPQSMLEEIDSQVGVGLPFHDRSEAIREYVSIGFQISAMIELAKDPSKKDEFEKKLAHLLNEKSYEKTLEGMSEKDLNAIIYIAANLKDKKVKQLVLDIKKS